MKCANCGFELEEGAVFCPNCGAKIDGVSMESNALNNDDGFDPEGDEKTVIPNDENNAVPEGESIFCHECGTKNSAGDQFCVNCGAPLGKQDISTASSFSGNKLPVKLILGIVAAVAAVAVLFFVFRGAFSGGISSSGSGELIYLKDNSLMRFASKANIELDDNIIDRDEYDSFNGISVKVTDDGSKCYFPKDYDGSTFDLCYCLLSKKTDGGTKIDSDVVYYNTIGNDRVVYIKDSSERKLYVSDTKGNKEKIGSEVDYFYISKDEKTLLWLTDASDENRLYSIDTSLKNDKVKIDSDVTRYLTHTDNFDNIYYLKEDSLYEVADLNDRNKIDSNIKDAWYAKDDDNIVIYYSIYDEDGINLLDLLLDDDKLKDDEAMKEPNISDYQRKETKDSFWGPQEQVVTDDSYYKDMEEYNKKLERDQVRGTISSYTSSNEEYYCYVPGQDPVKLTSGYGSFANNQAYGRGTVYYTINPEKVEKIKLSKMMNASYDEIEKKIRKALESGAEAHLNVFGKDVLLDIDLGEQTPVAASVDLKKKIAYISVGDKGISEATDSFKDLSLYKTDYSKGEGTMEKVCDEYDGYSARTIGDVFYFVRDRDKSGAGDLYADEEKISSDVYSFTALSEDKGILFSTDKDSKGKGTLNIYMNNKVVKLSDDVFDSLAVSDSNGNVAFLTDYSITKNRGDLKLYKNGKINSVDSDVNCIAYFD